MSQLGHQQLMIAIEHFQKTFQLLKASVQKTSEFDINRAYTADELEPYDALSDRFIRVVELALKFFRSYEYTIKPNKARR